jgi:peptidyl-prolyl cis-trans isomerase SurA
MNIRSNHAGMPMHILLRLVARLSSRFLVLGCSLISASCILAASVPSAQAQNVIATVNDDPITDYDIAERIKLNQVLHRPATRDAALEDIIVDRLKIGETLKFKINPTDQDIGNAIAVTARQMKTQPQAIIAGLQRAHVDQAEWKEHWKAEWVWGAYTRAMNKMLDVSDSDVRAEAAKEPNKTPSDQYTLRQVIMTLSPTASPAEVESRMREATQLRARFNDCAQGIQLASAIQNVAVKEPLTRSTTALGEQLRDLLDKTPVGHLTPPSRTTDGVEMVALCSKSALQDDTERDSQIRSELLDQRLQAASDKLLKDVRDHAVIVMKH